MSTKMHTHMIGEKYGCPVEKPVENVENSLFQPGFSDTSLGFRPESPVNILLHNRKISLFWRNYVSVITAARKAYFFTKTENFRAAERAGGRCRTKRSKIFV